MRLPIGREVIQRVPITALLVAMGWRPSANHQVLLHFVCASAAMVVLALVFIKQNRDFTMRPAGW